MWLNEALGPTGKGNVCESFRDNVLKIAAHFSHRFDFLDSETWLVAYSTLCPSATGRISPCVRISPGIANPHHEHFRVRRRAAFIGPPPNEGKPARVAKRLTICALSAAASLSGAQQHAEFNEIVQVETNADRGLVGHKLSTLAKVFVVSRPRELPSHVGCAS